MPQRRTQMQSRNYCFTLNNYTPEEVKSLKELAAHVTFICFQSETGESGTKHLQGVLQFPRKLGPRTVKSHVGERSHIEVVRGTLEQAVAYCSKEDTYNGEVRFQSGQYVTQGIRTDIEAFNLRIKTGASDADLINEHLNEFYKYHRVVDRVRLAFQVPRTWEMEVNVYWGKSGSGKTRRAFEEAGTSYYFVSKGDQNQTTWWDGYDGQDSVIIDDFYGWLPWSFMLRLLDRYPFTVQIKGGTVNFRSKKIFITSNSAPHNWYKNIPNNDMTPLLRRINKIEEMN